MSSCYREIGTVQKPYQYVGHEENTYNKDFATARIRMCLAFPDAYEVGMSNIGIQILYYVVNELEGYLADRVYAPLVDMGAMLKASDQLLLSKEANRPLGDFDVIGFTLQYELCYTNVLYMLDLAKVPRRASARGENHPLVIAGGPCVFNPEPVADFFDAFIVGEGEEVIVEFLQALEAAKAAGLSRKDTLRALQTIQGVYVPSHYTAIYRDDGSFDKLERGPDAPKWVERRIIKDLDKAPYPTKPVTPAIKPIHERVSVEVQRGCTRSCRFCQAGYIYRPRRERNPNTILDIITKSVEATGIADIGLLSLSSADYSHLHPLMKEVMARFKERHLSVSLPSTRLEALEEEYLDVLKEERRSGFTIAPEAGSQRLRNVINKNFTEEEVVETARMLFRNGWQSVKMYFMIGQPTETDDDVIAIAELANTVARRVSDLPGRKAITVSVSNFVPKPHTPFQWHEQITHAEIIRKQKLVKDHIKNKGQVSFRCHSADNSLAEGLLARGDRRAAALIERAYEKGAVFDCWQDRFDLAKWLAAAAELKEESGYDIVTQGLRGRSFDERLPWHRIYSGIHPKFFKNEYAKAVYGIATEDCSFAACHECGLCNARTDVAPVVFKDRIEVIAAQPKALAATPSVEKMLRFQYAKTDAGVFLATLDLQSIFVRAFNRAGITIIFDDGMRKRPVLSMGPALPLGVSSQCELFDLKITTSLTTAEVVARVNRRLPEHLQLLTAAELEPKAPGITQVISGVSYRVRADALALDDGPPLASRVKSLTDAERIIIRRERKGREGEVRMSIVDLKCTLSSLILDADWLRFTLDAPDGQAVSPHLVLDALMGDRNSDRIRLIPVFKTGFSSR